MKLLVANRGEIAIRIMRAAAELDIATVAVAPGDDAGSLHTGKADETVTLDGRGTAAYLDIDQIVAAARDTGCSAIHPGYGFLAENAELAKQCADAGLTFVGPHEETLRLFGDKARARTAAAVAEVPVIRGIDHAVSVEEAVAFFDTLDEGRGMMIKAVGGGGGRGSRRVDNAGDVAATYERCGAEAKTAFGNGDLYVEEFIPRARHVEVQILGDADGTVVHLGERECSVQRYFQKIIEVAPAPGLADDLRERILDAAVHFASSVGYCNAGTFEFLVDVSGAAADEPFAFIETNARLQVEHTVTEEVTGVDIVKAQLRLAGGETIGELGLDKVARPRGYAIQARVCMESVREDGAILPASGTLTAYEPPSGPGVRTDGFGYAGYETSLSFDSLLAKVIGYSPTSDFDDAVARTSRALAEFRIEGVETNIDFLQTILAHPDFATARIHTRFVDEHMGDLATAQTPRRFVAPSGQDTPESEDGFAGARVEDAQDPLALFDHDSRTKAQEDDAGESSPAGPTTLQAPVPGTVVTIHAAVGDHIVAGQPIATVESLELDHVVRAERSFTVDAVLVAAGDAVRAGGPLFLVTESDTEGHWSESATSLDLDMRRSDLALLDQRRTYTEDDFRAEKIASRRHAREQRSPRENIEHLMDGTFREYGPLVTAASWQKQEWLRETTQADGLVMGIGNINGDLFDDDASRAVAVHYDYMVVAGTQGGRGHYKQDRMYELAGRYRLPLVLFAEGGGGRPGISGGERAVVRDIAVEAGLRRPGDATPRSRAAAVDVAGRGGGGVPVDSYTFTKLCELSGRVPLVGVNSGRCFAGNTVMLASCDVIIAAENSTIGLGGPAMIEGGGLGIYTPEEVGPMSFQVPNGVVDILVKDDEEAIETTKKYLSYFQGPVQRWDFRDQRRLRHIIPENRTETYDMREVIQTLADEDSILEIREAFGVGIITAFIRIEGRPLGLIANNPQHLSGAIDSDAADKGARFLQLCDTFDIPVLSLMDCPGIMPGPEYERAALLRHSGRLFVTGANMTTPMFGVVLRKAYGMGVRAMCGGSSLEPFFTVAWPTAEFADMTIDGRVKLMFGEELDALENADERQAIYERLLAAHVDRIRAVNSGGTNYGVDDVAPADGLADDLRERIIDAAVRFAATVGYSNAGTFEFLVHVSDAGEPFAFIETNARLDDSHAVTEEVIGMDIVKAQIKIARGATLADLGLNKAVTPRGFAIEARVCMESVREDGAILPTAGTLAAYEAPSGPGVRTDGFGYAGYETSLSFDSLLAKVVGHSPSNDLADAAARTRRALAEFRIEGVETNIHFLQNILVHPDFAGGGVDTRFVEEHIAELAAAREQPRFVTPSGFEPNTEVAEQEQQAIGPEGSVGLASPIQGTIVEIGVGVGDDVRIGQAVAVVEAMKLQHDIRADRNGVVCAVSMAQGDVVREGYPIVFIHESDVEGGAVEGDDGIDLDHIRGDLEEVNDLIEERLDASLPDAVAATHASGRRTARENLDDLLDEGSFREFGPPAAGSALGGTVMGFGSVNAELVGEERSRVAVVHSNYPAAVYTHGHYRQEQVHELVHDWRLPLVLFSEGEGQPYGNVGSVGMDASVFTDFAKLSGLVPLIGVNLGDCFAGNAALLACCDVIIATENSTIGMTGPAVVEASGMGAHTKEDLGSMSFQAANGDVDILAKDDADAVDAVKRYVSYFQGPVADWEAPDQRRMRHIIPENRVRTYEMRDIIHTLADEGSVLEIRKDFGFGVITAFIRVEGQPMGVVANNPAHLAGAVDSPGADKGARFFQLCDAFDIPVVVFMDCPGIMVGPDHERTALVRHAVRLFNIGANCTTPMFGIMVRKAYGLGVQAMIGGASSVPLLTVAWPTAEFAGMNIDGAVKLSARRELAAIEDPEERKAAYERRVAQGYESARAVNSGARYVIDPADTRAFITRGMKSLPPVPPRTAKKRPYVDTW